MEAKEQAEAIQRRMQAVRREVDDEMIEFMQSTRAKSDWRYYVRKFPAICLGGAAVAGFLVVPKLGPPRTPAKPRTAWVEGDRLVVKAERRGFRIGPILAALASVAARRAFSYAGQQALGALSPHLESWGRRARGGGEPAPHHVERPGLR